jgi:hypothetical protein
MYEVNYGLKNKIRRVIVLQRAPITQTARAKLVALGSPFGKYVLKHHRAASLLITSRNGCVASDALRWVPDAVVDGSRRSLEEAVAA